MFFGGQGGGFPFHNNGPNNANVDNKKFYELLGVEKDAEESQIKKAYKKKAMQHHPDRGGDAETFKEIPIDRILVETDSPYLAPEPLRGKSNEPSYIIHTIKFLSNLKKTSFEKFSEQTSLNFFKLFGNLK